MKNFESGANNYEAERPQINDEKAQKFGQKLRKLFGFQKRQQSAAEAPRTTTTATTELSEDDLDNVKAGDINFNPDDIVTTTTTTTQETTQETTPQYSTETTVTQSAPQAEQIAQTTTTGELSLDELNQVTAGNPDGVAES